MHRETCTGQGETIKTREVETGGIGWDTGESQWMKQGTGSKTQTQKKMKKTPRIKEEER